MGRTGNTKRKKLKWGESEEKNGRPFLVSRKNVPLP